MLALYQSGYSFICVLNIIWLFHLILPDLKLADAKNVIQVLFTFFGYKDIFDHESCAMAICYATIFSRKLWQDIAGNFPSELCRGRFFRGHSLGPALGGVFWVATIVGGFPGGTVFWGQFLSGDRFPGVGFWRTTV